MVAKIKLPVETIVERWQSGETTRDLAKAFNVNPSTILTNIRTKLTREQIRSITRQLNGSSPTREASDLEKAWSAGFFDGEGSINILNPTVATGYRMKVTCAQKKHAAPLEKIHEIWGGRIGHNAKRDIFLWAASSVQASNFLQDILPYLLVKKDQAVLAIEFQKLRYNGHRLTEDILLRDLEYKTRLQEMR